MVAVEWYYYWYWYWRHGGGSVFVVGSHWSCHLPWQNLVKRKMGTCTMSYRSSWQYSKRWWCRCCCCWWVVVVESMASRQLSESVRYHVLPISVPVGSYLDRPTRRTCDRDWWPTHGRTTVTTTTTTVATPPRPRNEDSSSSFGSLWNPTLEKYR